MNALEFPRGLMTARNSFILTCFGLVFAVNWSAALGADFRIRSAEWNDSRHRLSVSGDGTRRMDVTVVNAYDESQQIGTDTVNRRSRWRVTNSNLSVVPCRIRATQEDGSTAEHDVANAPSDCAPTGGGGGGGGGGGSSSDTSINSTSANSLPNGPVPEQPQVTLGSNGFQVLAANDLGMHCGDLDTRISSILPPFNVLHAQVIRKGGEPDILDDSQVSVHYSAASNPDDPILLQPVAPGLQNPPAGSPVVYKTNYWGAILAGSYDPFYPPTVTPLAPSVTTDRGLPVPDLEQLYPAGGGAGSLVANQQDMPGISAPYTNNDPQQFTVFARELPFFVGFPFGYRVEDVNWFEAAGIPMAAFDDAGRENPYPLMRVEARNTGGTVIASQDVVAPISGEANCQNCHGSPADGSNGSAIKALQDAGMTVVASLDDPEYNQVPNEVSVEYASDINLLKLHDLKQGTHLIAGTEKDPDTSGSPAPFKPVVCQVCHYTPALDLAHVGPKGEGDADANGRQQTDNQSMSRVMHNAHADAEDVDGNRLFPDMPPPVDSNGNRRSVATGHQVMEETCYQCHPGNRTQCLRGAMSNGGMFCQDCHGDMKQVGDDFTRDKPGGSFLLASDFYTNPATARVPWGNEPGCGSCHTGDAMSSLAGTAGTLVSPTDTDGVADGIRLLQAYLSDDPKATPIVPTNKRFAEDTVANGPAAGNPMLYRVSDGHEGVFCEACHGSTHAIWPNANPNANDNVAANQAQGHSGKITECSACHTGDLGTTLEGPHGMHPVGEAGLRFINNHEDLAERNANACRACHGRTGQGTVLSKVAVDRTFTVEECEHGTLCPGGETHNVSVTLKKGDVVSCVMCHENELN